MKHLSSSKINKEVMKQTLIILSLACLFASACNNSKEKNHTQTTMTDSIPFKNGYSEVNGLKMYYEIHGEGKPLVLLHGGGSTIQTTFGRIIPIMAKNRQLIGVELQAHGRTSDRNTDLSFEQDADDVAALLKKLGIEKADIMGFSNGANTAMQIAIRHPNMAGRIIAASPLCKRSGAFPEFFEFMKGATLEHMPQQLKEAYLKVAPDPKHLQVMHDKCAKRMVEFRDWDDTLLRAIKVPVLLMFGNNDVATAEHAVELYRKLPAAELAILPGGHGDYIGEITTLSAENKDTVYAVPMIEKFLNKSRLGGM
jgi:pimeloyl-ACP methyl ester carboxylesterase